MSMANDSDIHCSTFIFIIQTQIGQLTLDKADVSNIKEIASIGAKVEFTSEPEEKINANYHIYSGTVQNKGLETASFVRVIFKLWSSETELIATDSSFVDGNQIIYHSGIHTDTALKPGESGEYVVNVKTPIDSNMAKSAKKNLTFIFFNSGDKNKIKVLKSLKIVTLINFDKLLDTF